MPAALNAANFARSNVPGFASSVISASGRIGTRARTPARMASIDSGEKRLGVPPPRNALTMRRPQIDGSANSRSLISAAT